jgi:P-type Cu+ transporter
MNQPEPSVSLQIEGMDCANCALGITRRLTKAGHSDVKVNFATGEASLCLNPASNLDQAIADVESLGYHVVRNVEGQKNATNWFSTEKKFWFCLIFTLPLFFGHMFLPNDSALQNPWFQLALCLPVFAVGVLHFGKSAFGSIKSGIPNMDVLIFIGSTAAFLYSLYPLFIALPVGTHAHDYLFFETTATIITLVLLGNLIEHRSVKATTTAIGALQELKPEKARKITAHNDHEHLQEIPADQLCVGDLIQVNSGESIAADGEVVFGDAEVNEAMISGESRPAHKIAGTEVVGGTIVVRGNLRIRITRIGADTVLARIITLVKDAQFDKPPVQRLADRISAVFVPVVLGIAVLTFLLAWLAFHVSLTQSMLQAIAVLVISCPCAMGLATPTAVSVGIGRAARSGILIRGGTTLEELARIEKVVFDKTGTLTTGKFSIQKIESTSSFTEAEIKSILQALETRSTHPIAQSITQELQQENILADTRFQHISEEKGIGLSAIDQEGNSWTLGSWRSAGLEADADADLYLCCNKQQLAAIYIKDEIRPDAKTLIDFLKSKNIDVVMLSGDQLSRCKPVADYLGITEIHAAQLPADKATFMRATTTKQKAAMIGDGINDAPALALATVGISVSDASKIAMQSAQVVLLGNAEDGGLLKLREAIQIGQHGLLTIKQNLFWAFFYNVIAIPIAALGFLSPMVAALSMAFSDVVVIGNSIRFRFKKIF